VPGGDPRDRAIEELRAAAHQLAMTLDQVGELSDADRARRRHVTLGKQQPDGMSPIQGPALHRPAPPRRP
jgi:hypothetical protein